MVAMCFVVNIITVLLKSKKKVHNTERLHLEYYIITTLYYIGAHV